MHKETQEDTDSLFGELRSILQRPDAASRWSSPVCASPEDHQDLWRLIDRLYRAAPDRLEHEVVPYVEDYTRRDTARWPIGRRSALRRWADPPDARLLLCDHAEVPIQRLLPGRSGAPPLLTSPFARNLRALTLTGGPITTAHVEALRDAPVVLHALHFRQPTLDHDPDRGNYYELNTAAQPDVEALTALLQTRSGGLSGLRALRFTNLCSRDPNARPGAEVWRDSPHLDALERLEIDYTLTPYTRSVTCELGALREVGWHPLAMIDGDALLAVLCARQLSSLRALSLAAQPLHDDAARALLQHPRFAHLDTLNLHACGLRDEALIAIAHHPDTMNLRHIDLGRNALTSEGAAEVARSRAFQHMHRPVLYMPEDAGRSSHGRYLELACSPSIPGDAIGAFRSVFDRTTPAWTQACDAASARALPDDPARRHRRIIEVLAEFSYRLDVWAQGTSARREEAVHVQHLCLSLHREAPELYLAEALQVASAIARKLYTRGVCWRVIADRGRPFDASAHPPGTITELDIRGHTSAPELAASALAWLADPARCAALRELTVRLDGLAGDVLAGQTLADALTSGAPHLTRLSVDVHDSDPAHFDALATAEIPAPERVELYTNTRSGLDDARQHDATRAMARCLASASWMPGVQHLSLDSQRLDGDVCASWVEEGACWAALRTLSLVSAQADVTTALGLARRLPPRLYALTLPVCGADDAVIRALAGWSVEHVEHLNLRGNTTSATAINTLLNHTHTIGTLELDIAPDTGALLNHVIRAGARITTLRLYGTERALQLDMATMWDMRLASHTGLRPVEVIYQGKYTTFRPKGSGYVNILASLCVGEEFPAWHIDSIPKTLLKRLAKGLGARGYSRMNRAALAPLVASLLTPTLSDEARALLADITP